jgi:zinc protease
LEPLQTGVTTRVEIAGKSQSDLVVGTAGPERAAPEYMAAAIGNNILGRFGLMGRIGEAVREKAGLAYYAFSGLGGGLGPGPWTVSAGVDPSNEEKAIALIHAEIERFVSEPVSEEELENSQSSYIGRMPLSLESNSGVAGAILNIERHQLGMDYLQRYPDIVSAVTREQILAAAARHLEPDKLAVSVAGPPREAD